MINIRLEKASNGAILRGNIGENGSYRTELFVFKDGWEQTLNDRLDTIEILAQDRLTSTINNIRSEASDMEENTDEDE